jgi:predicted HTH domain antitoxin
MNNSLVKTSFEIFIPKPLLQLGIDQEEIQQRVTQWLVLSLFTEGRISSGKAANLLNISRLEFLALLKSQGIAFIDYTADELAEEYEAVENLKIKV